MSISDVQFEDPGVESRLTAGRKRENHGANRLWGALRRSWRLLIALAILGAVVAVLVPASHPKKVKSAVPYSAIAVVGTAPNGPNSPLNGAVTASQIAFVANSTTTLQDVADQAGLDVPDSELPGYLSASVVAPPAPSVRRNRARVARSRGTRRPSSISWRTAPPRIRQSSWPTSMRSSWRPKWKPPLPTGSRRTRSRGAAKGAGAYTGYQVIHPAAYAGHGTKAKTSLTSSRKVRLLAGLIIGALIGAGIVLLRELLDKRLRSANRAASNFGFPVVVEIPALPMKGGQAVGGQSLPVDVVREPDSPGAEAYRMLRMSVLFESLAPQSAPADPYGYEYGQGVLVDAPRSGPAVPVSALGERKVVMVVSAGTEPSRPHVAANLAAIYARGRSAGHRGLDRRHRGGQQPAHHRRPAPGDPPRGRRGPDAAVAPGVRLPPAVGPVHRQQRRAGDPDARAVLDAARTLCDVVIVEVPPLLAVHHAEALARAVDVVLVVGECGATTFGDARKAGDLLRRIDAPVLGVVLTNVRIDQKDIRFTVPRRVVPVAPQPEPEPAEREAVLALGPGAGSGPGGSPPSSY